MELIVDDHHPGTDERTWLGTSRLTELPRLSEWRPRRLVVVAPHPDDEVLGAGGLLGYMADVGVETTVVSRSRMGNRPIPRRTLPSRPRGSEGRREADRSRSAWDVAPPLFNGFAWSTVRWPNALDT